MRYVGPYAAAATPTYDVLASVSTKSRCASLAALSWKINPAIAAYAATLPNAHALVPLDLTDAEKATLVDGYDGRSAVIKRYLDTMRKSLGPVHLNLCPYCNLETTGQLDHYLPKTRYPEFALYSLNLLPICPLCNQSKGNSIVNDAGERLFLMPIADAAVSQRVLIADLVIYPVPRVTYSIDPKALSLADDLALITRHFKRLGLARRYRRRASSLISAIKLNVKAAGGTQRIARAAIRNGHATAKLEEPTNSWRRALYEAITAQVSAFEHWLMH